MFSRVRDSSPSASLAVPPQSFRPVRRSLSAMLLGGLTAAMLGLAPASASAAGIVSEFSANDTNATTGTMNLIYPALAPYDVSYLQPGINPFNYLGVRLTFHEIGSYYLEQTFSQNPYDTVAILYSQFNSADPQANYIAGDDDSAGDLKPAFNFNIVAPGTYDVLVSTFSSNTTLEYPQNFRITGPGVVDFGSIATAIPTGLLISSAQDTGILSGIQGMLGDINGHLFSLRAGGGQEGGIDEGVTTGEGDGPEDAIARTVQRSELWQVYTTVNYSNISLSSIREQAGVNSQTWAPGVGVERRFAPGLTAGFAANLLETHQSYTSGLGSLDVEGVALSTYASYVSRSYWLDLLYSWGRYDLDSARNGTGFPQAQGETTAFSNALQLNAGWTFRVPAWNLVHGPLAGVDWMHLNVDGYSETGGGAGALAYADRNVDSLITRVGWTVSRPFETKFARITPQFRLTYERQNITSSTGTTVNLINLPFTATASNEHPAQNYVVAGAGVSFAFTQGFSVMLTYQGQFFRDNLQAHSGMVRFNYSF